MRCSLVASPMRLLSGRAAANWNVKLGNRDIVCTSACRQTATNNQGPYNRLVRLGGWRLATAQSTDPHEFQHFSDALEAVLRLFQLRFHSKNLEGIGLDECQQAAPTTRIAVTIVIVIE